MFFCFYSAIFQLTSAKFQTFAYDSRTVGSSYMKFWQQFEINELYVSTKFRGNWSRDFGLEPENRPHKFSAKSRLHQKRLKYGKKIFHMVICLKTSFHPNQPTFGCDEVYFFFFLFFPFISFFFISFFSFFFFLIFVRSSSPKPQTSKFNFCVKLLSCKRNFFSQNFFGQLHREPPKMGPQNNQFF